MQRRPRTALLLKLAVLLLLLLMPCVESKKKKKKKVGKKRPMHSTDNRAFGGEATGAALLEQLLQTRGNSNSQPAFDFVQVEFPIDSNFVKGDGSASRLDALHEIHDQIVAQLSGRVDRSALSSVLGKPPAGGLAGLGTAGIKILDLKSGKLSALGGLSAHAQQAERPVGAWERWGFRCHGTVAKELQGSTLAECQDACTEMTKCNYYSYKTGRLDAEELPVTDLRGTSLHHRTMQVAFLLRPLSICNMYETLGTNTTQLKGSAVNSKQHSQRDAQKQPVAEHGDNRSAHDKVEGTISEPGGEDAGDFDTSEDEDCVTDYAGCYDSNNPDSSCKFVAGQKETSKARVLGDWLTDPERQAEMDAMLPHERLVHTMSQFGLDVPDVMLAPRGHGMAVQLSLAEYGRVKFPVTTKCGF